jgi:hypothetical protein
MDSLSKMIKVEWAAMCLVVGVVGTLVCVVAQAWGLTLLGLLVVSLALWGFVAALRSGRSAT